MSFSMAARVLTIGFIAMGMIVVVGGTTSYAHIHKAKWVVAKAPSYVQESNVKLRYYGGPKSPMYP